MRFAKWAFTGAGIYGILTVAPLYFLESYIGKATGPIVIFASIDLFLCALFIASWFKTAETV